jgi:hypothetical protein
MRELAILAALLVGASGCVKDSTTSPEPADEAPTLPAPERLSFDWSFFDEREATERARSQNHFFNAYIRAIVVQAVTHFVLTPPVTAFALALHTVPSPQPDGSYLWIYTWAGGDEEAQIRLRGRPLADRVEWELRVTALHANPPLDNELWFEGETWHDADAGFWRFYDFEREGKPAVARIDWGTDHDGSFLRFTDLYENPEDTLEYRELGELGSITFTDADDSSLSWFIRWNEADGTGSIQAPDHNGGEEGCWDENQQDTQCPTIS